MIVKNNFDPLKIFTYIWRETLYSLAVATAVLLAFNFLPFGKELALPFVPIGVLGSALAIFVAFRNNSAYGRWWEARQN